MAENRCPQCGAPIDPGAAECKFCGEKLAGRQAAQQQYYQQQPQQQYYQQPPQQPYYQQPPQQQYYQQPYYQQPMYPAGVNPTWPLKSKIAAGLLGIFLGGLGIHKFYLGKTGMGIVYILLCWTCIPAIIGLIEGIVYLCTTDENFQLKYHVRLQ